jgi:hypothetical protein
MEAKHLKVGDVRAALAELTATAYLAAGDKLEPVEGGGGYYTLVDAGYTRSMAARTSRPPIWMRSRTSASIWRR